MLLLKFPGPRVWFDNTEITDQCLSLEMFPGQMAHAHICAGVDSLGIRKQVIIDHYEVVSYGD
jgi:hypothetical protein